MGLNVKVALLVSLGVIASVCWIVHSAALPSRRDVSAPSAGGERVGNVPPPAPDDDRGRAGAALRSAPEASSPGTFLARPSVVERSAGLAQDAETSLVLVPPSRSPAGEMVSLPPLKALAETDGEASTPPPDRKAPAVASGSGAHGPTSVEQSHDGRPQPIARSTAAGRAGNVEGEPLVDDRPASPAVGAGGPVAGPGGEGQRLAMAAGVDGEPSVDAVEPQGGGDPASAGRASQAKEGGAATLALSNGRYQVRRGDTLTGIARSVLGSDAPEAVRRLLEANPRVRSRRDRLFVGEYLVIPGVATAGAGGTRAERSGRGLAGAAQSAAAPQRAGQRAPTTDRKGGGAGWSQTSARGARGKVATSRAATRWYTVRRSDSLVSIAQRELKDTNRWREIVEMNKLKHADKITPGTRLKLPAPRGGSGADT